MGLDWIVLPKEENGVTKQPSETAGSKQLDKADPETVARFREIYDEKRSDLEHPGPPPDPEKRRGVIGSMIDVFTGAGRLRKQRYKEALEDWEHRKSYFDLWNKTFEEALDYFASGDPPPVVIEASEDSKDALGSILGVVCDIYDFRGNELREDFNAVSHYAAYTLKMVYPDMLYSDMNPEEMTELADDLEKALNAFRGSDEEQDEVSIADTEGAIRWLRFWAGKSHSMAADF